MQKLLTLVGDASNDIPEHVKGAILRAMQTEAPPKHHVVYRDETCVKWPTSCRTSILGPAGLARRPTKDEVRATSLDKLLGIGMNLTEMYHTGLSLSDLLAMGLLPSHLLVTGASGRPLMPLRDFQKMYGVGKQWMEEALSLNTNFLSRSKNKSGDYAAAGYAASDFLSVEDMVNTGIDVSEFTKVLGLTRVHLRSLHPDKDICTNQGWSYSAIKQAMSCNDQGMSELGLPLVITTARR
jgi:hypothetical protein